VIAATVIALLVLPLVVLRGRTLLAYYGADAATWLFAWLLWRRLPQFDPYLGCVVLAVIKLATLSLYLAAGKHVRWSANRAALLAAVVYALAIPAMLRTPIDGDEPFYLLQTASIAGDFDLDLANQYRTRAAAAWGREDIVEPQPGDPRGDHGQQYSRHEPFLALLMLPGYWLGGLHGALATIALFGVLLVRSTIRWMEDEGISEEAARAVFPLFAFAPPVLFYATRIWPEVPAAFFFVEALRGMREHRAKRWLPALFGLVMLKLRFVLVAAGVVVRRKVAIPILLVPLAVIWFITGDATNVHTWRELIPTNPMRYLTGLGGLLADGMSGLAFQAPFYLFFLFAVARWKKTPHGFRAGLLASLLYLFYLVPRGEWFGGWAPPLRYLVFLMPVLALGIASVWNELSRGAIAVVSAWSVGLVIHGLAHPWRLFHEFTGENALGEWLSQRYGSDFSRLFPSFIRLNEAAWWGILGVLLFVFALRKMEIPALALAMAIAFHFGRQPAERVEFEDTHVTHDAGRIYPDPYTVMRATYRNGWVLEGGQSLSFLVREGTYTLDFITGLGATFELAGNAYSVPPGARYQTVRVTVPKSGRVTLRCLSGAVNLDRMERQ
jgi:energy-converting hydrogenase Eha subunit A